MFADARGEDERVKALQRGGQRSQFAANPINEQLDRLGRLRAIAPHWTTPCADKLSAHGAMTAAVGHQ